MKVSLLSGDYLPNTGGIAAHVNGLAVGLHSNGHGVGVAVPAFTRHPLRRGMSVERGEGFPVLRSRVWLPPMLSRARAVRRQVERIASVPEFRDAEVVHWHTPALDGEVAVNTPAWLRVFTNHTSHFLQWVLQGENPERARRALVGADAVICPSTELAEATIAAGFEPARVHFVPNGVDVDRFSPAIDGNALRTALGIARDEVLFLCPRRLAIKNGVPYWLKAVPSVLQHVGTGAVRFLLVGDYGTEDSDSDMETVRTLLRDLPLDGRVIWSGRADPAEMPAYMAAADAVVLPSLLEATSIAGLEAMATGKPLIGTRVGGIPQIVQDGESGVLVPAADSEALAAAMLAIASDAELRARMGAAARERAVAEFSWGAVSRLTADIYAAELDAAAAARGRPGARRDVGMATGARRVCSALARFSP